MRSHIQHHQVVDNRGAVLADDVDVDLHRDLHAALELLHALDAVAVQ